MILTITFMVKLLLFPVMCGRREQLTCDSLPRLIYLHTSLHCGGGGGQVITDLQLHCTAPLLPRAPDNELVADGSKVATRRTSFQAGAVLLPLSVNLRPPHSHV